MLIILFLVTQTEYANINRQPKRNPSSIVIRGVIPWDCVKLTSFSNPKVNRVKEQPAERKYSNYLINKGSISRLYEELNKQK